MRYTSDRGLVGVIASPGLNRVQRGHDMTEQTAAEVRAGLDHPIVDGDGHWVEYHPVMMEA